MAPAFPGLGNSTNWDWFIFGSKTSEKLSDGTYRAIEPFISNRLLEAKLIAVSCSSETAPSYYKNAGWLTQTVYTGLLHGDNTDCRIDKSWFLLLDRVNLIIPNPNFSNYSVRIDVPYWYDDITIIAYEYMGPTNDSLVNQLTDMDVKLDLLLGN